MVLQLLGALGLFLLGMVIMTDGLRALAGDAMRRLLIRFTRSPLSGAVTGTLTTALLQSSSATTVAAVGFVGADLISFPAALGIIFGANIGTTVTGWMVALVGFKLQLGAVALPLVLVGAVLRLAAPGRVRNAGLAVAGFGLVFAGVAAMQDAMGGLQAALVFDRLPDARLPLVLVGLVFTALTQSSSAGVAAALTAVYTGAIDFGQAAALVIGMDVGTTVTAALAGLGGTPAARRTGFSHGVYNVLTAVAALALLDAYVWLWDRAGGGVAAAPEIALVGFHTAFNVLGVIAVLPVTRPFARMMERLVPGGGPAYTSGLDPALLGQPEAALAAVLGSIRLEFAALVGHLSALVGGPTRGTRAPLPALQTALDETHAYVDRIHVGRVDDAHGPRLLASIHALDHLQRLHERCAEETRRADAAARDEDLAAVCEALVRSNHAVLDAVVSHAWPPATAAARATQAAVEAMEPAYRDSVVDRVARGALDVHEGTERLEAVRWLRRVSTHVARTAAYVEKLVVTSGA